MHASGCMEKTVQHKSIRIINVQLEIFSRPSLSTLSVHYHLSWCFLSSFIAITVITTFNETIHQKYLWFVSVSGCTDFNISSLSCRGKKKVVSGLWPQNTNGVTETNTQRAVRRIWAHHPAVYLRRASDAGQDFHRDVKVPERSIAGVCHEVVGS